MGNRKAGKERPSISSCKGSWGRRKERIPIERHHQLTDSPVGLKGIERPRLRKRSRGFEDRKIPARAGSKGLTEKEGN